MQGRWELMGGPLGRITVVDGPSSLGIGETVWSVPCDDAAIERAAKALAEGEWDQDDALHGMWRDLASKALAAAGETP